MAAVAASSTDNNGPAAKLQPDAGWKLEAGGRSEFTL
jgi:hypothetical protein